MSLFKRITAAELGGYRRWHQSREEKQNGPYSDVAHQIQHKAATRRFILTILPLVWRSKVKPRFPKNTQVAPHNQRHPLDFRGVGGPHLAGNGVLFQDTAFKMPRSRDLSANNPF